MTTRTIENYFENRMNSYEFDWDETSFEIAEDEKDKILYQDFLISGIIQIKKHTKPFINSIINIVTNVVEDTTPAMIKNVIKKGGIM